MREKQFLGGRCAGCGRSDDVRRGGAGEGMGVSLLEGEAWGVRTWGFENKKGKCLRRWAQACQEPCMR